MDKYPARTEDRELLKRKIKLLMNGIQTSIFNCEDLCDACTISEERAHGYETHFLDNSKSIKFSISRIRAEDLLRKFNSEKFNLCRSMGINYDQFAEFFKNENLLDEFLAEKNLTEEKALADINELTERLNEQQELAKTLDVNTLDYLDEVQDFHKSPISNLTTLAVNKCLLDDSAQTTHALIGELMNMPTNDSDQDQADLEELSQSVTETESLVSYATTKFNSSPLPESEKTRKFPTILPLSMITEEVSNFAQELQNDVGCYAVQEATNSIPGQYDKEIKIIARIESERSMKSTQQGSDAKVRLSEYLNTKN